MTEPPKPKGCSTLACPLQAVKSRCNQNPLCGGEVGEPSRNARLEVRRYAAAPVIAGPLLRIRADRSERNRLAGSAAPCPYTRHCEAAQPPWQSMGDRKSTRLNSSHVAISYAVFCLKKK